MLDSYIIDRIKRDKKKREEERFGTELHIPPPPPYNPLLDPPEPKSAEIDYQINF